MEEIEILKLKTYIYDYIQKHKISNLTYLYNLELKKHILNSYLLDNEQEENQDLYYILFNVYNKVIKSIIDETQNTLQLYLQNKNIYKMQIDENNDFISSRTLEQAKRIKSKQSFNTLLTICKTINTTIFIAFSIVFAIFTYILKIIATGSKRA